MKKNICFAIAVSVLFLVSSCSGCARGKNSNDEEWWFGTFSDDSVSLIINTKGVCRIITSDVNIGAEYVWDVDRSALLVTDENGVLHLFQRDEDKLVSPEGTKLSKRE